ncbi:MAG: alpha/beta hydrolase [Solirubrobacterales bacterium]
MAAVEIQRGVCVEAAEARLAGALYLPPSPNGFVLFASSRDLGRIDRRQVDLSKALNRRGLGTLLFDLVEPNEGPEVANDVEELSKRLVGATEWSHDQWGVADLPIGYVGSGMGSAAALSAAALLGPEIDAIASHSGRPDLACEDLGEVLAPTLLIVDAGDPPLAAANATAAALLHCPHRLCQVKIEGKQVGTWQATPAICRWMEWHLGSPEVPYKNPLTLDWR